MRICLVLADQMRGDEVREESLQRIKDFARVLTAKGVQSVILHEIVDEQARGNSVDVQAFDGGILWEFHREERPEDHHISDSHFDDVLYKIVWEYGIDVVHLLYGPNQLPNSLAPLAALLGTRLVISSPDCTFTCPKNELFDQDGFECTGPESVEKCTDCLSCGKFFTHFANKHRVILWFKHLQRVLNATALVTSPNESILEVLKASRSSAPFSVAVLEWILADVPLDVLVNAYYQAYQSLGIATESERSDQSLTVVMPALREWLEKESQLDLAEHLKLSLESLYEQGVRTKTQVIVAIDANQEHVVQYCTERFVGLDLIFLAFSFTPNISGLLLAARQVVRGTRVTLLPVTRSYCPRFIAAHTKSALASLPAAALLGLTTWAHSKPLAPLEEYVLSESISYSIAGDSVPLGPTVPWQGISFPATLLEGVQPGKMTIGDALGVPLTVYSQPEALSALNEAITLETWLSIARGNSAILGNPCVSDSDIERDPELKQLHGAINGTLTSHRTLGLATLDGIIAYGELHQRLLRTVTPGVWVKREH